MKKILLMITVLFAMSAVFGSNAMGKGQTQFNAGIGLSSWGLPVYLGLDYGLNNDITLGGELSFRSYEEDYHDHDYNHSIMGVSGNANYHFNNLLDIPSEWDFYAGLSLGFFIWNSPGSYEGSKSSGLGVSGQIGGRYYFTEKLGVNLEFGGGNAFSGGKLGVSVKL